MSGAAEEPQGAAPSVLAAAIERMRRQYLEFERVCAAGDLSVSEYESHERVITLAAQVIQAETAMVLAAESQMRMAATAGTLDAAVIAAQRSRFGGRH